MENLTVKELGVLARGFGLPTSGLKIELLNRINQHLLQLFSMRSSIEYEIPSPSAMQTDGNRMTIISRFKNKFLHPLSRFAEAISSTHTSDNANFTIVNESNLWIWLREVAIMIGFFGGIHSLTQLLQYFFGEPATLTFARNW